MLCKTSKYFGFQGSAPDPTGRAYSASPNHFAEINIILFEIITEILREKQFCTCNTKFPIALKNYLCL